jgi:hypothetical protein
MAEHLPVDHDRVQVHPLAGRRHTCEPFNVEHDAVVQFVEEFQANYPPQVSDRVEEECWGVLGQSLVAKVVDAQSLSAHVPREEVEQKFLSPMALTTAALGMVFESEGLRTRIGGALGVKKIG